MKRAFLLEVTCVMLFGMIKLLREDNWGYIFFNIIYKAIPAIRRILLQGFYIKVAQS